MEYKDGRIINLGEACEEDMWELFKTCDPSAEFAPDSDPYIAYKYRDHLEFLARMAIANPEVFSRLFLEIYQVKISSDEIKESIPKDVFNFFADGSFEDFLLIPFSDDELRMEICKRGEVFSTSVSGNRIRLIHPDDARIPRIE